MGDAMSEIWEYSELDMDINGHLWTIMDFLNEITIRLLQINRQVAHLLT